LFGSIPKRKGKLVGFGLALTGHITKPLGYSQFNAGSHLPYFSRCLTQLIVSRTVSVAFSAIPSCTSFGRAARFQGFLRESS
jgi:hypothetical protein